VIEATLRCRGCQATYPIHDGVPRMMPSGSASGPGTGHRWTQFSEAVPEYEESFRDFASPLGPDDFIGKLVLDAGAGFGRHAFSAARWGAEVVALDSSEEAVASAAKNLAGRARAHVVLGDVMRPPFRRGVFDLVYCFGVLHHLADPRAAFRGLGELVRPGGRLSTWTYGPRQGLTAVAIGALRGATAQLGTDRLHLASRAIATGLRVFSHTPNRFLGGVPLLGGVLRHLPVHDHHRWPYDVVVADVFDRLRIPVTHTFTGEEIERWFVEAGYADIQVSRRVRNTESFRGTGVRR
jgi:SAM-dependent methyltransferase